MTHSVLFRSAAVLVLVLFSGCVSHPAPMRVRPPGLDEDAVLAESQHHYDYVMRRYQQYIARLERVSAPLLIGSATYCGEDIIPRLGLAVLSLEALRSWTPYVEDQREIQDAAKRTLEIGEGATVIAVSPGSPAERAGVAEADVLETVNGRRITKIADLRKTLREGRHETPAIVLRRGGEVVESSLDYIAACDTPMRVFMSTSVWATASYSYNPKGRGVSISTGMMDFLESDDELAIVLGHEIAHTMLRHKKGRSPKHGKRMELEADYLGLYLAARAGLNISGAPAFWRRYASVAPAIVSDRQRSHPGSPERAMLVEATVREIEAKRERGDPLEPELGY